MKIFALIKEKPGEFAIVVGLTVLGIVCGFLPVLVVLGFWWAVDWVLGKYRARKQR